MRGAAFLAAGVLAAACQPTAVVKPEDVTIKIGQSIQFDGTESFDPNQSELSYAWSVAAAPMGSTSTPTPDDEAVATFTPDVSGQYTISLQVSNGILPSEPAEATLTVNPANTAPVISYSGASTREVPLGSTLHVTFTATDADEDALAASTIPASVLGGSLTFGFDGVAEIWRGEFVFHPSPGQSDFDVALRVSDGELSDTETITVDITSGDSGGNGSVLQGYAFDANRKATSGNDVALSGVRVCAIDPTDASCDSGQTACDTTDSNGFFEVIDLPAGANFIEYCGENAVSADPIQMGEEFGSYRATVHLLEDTITVLDRPIYLMRIDGTTTIVTDDDPPQSLTDIDPDVTNIVENDTLGVKLTIPPHTVKLATGVDYEGPLTISSVPPAFTPGALPDDLSPSFVISLQPMGLFFATPVPIEFPNTDGLDDDMETDIWSLDHQMGAFFVAGRGRVDGSTVTSIPGEGGILETSWHFLSPGGPGAYLASGEDVNFDPDRDTMCAVGSDVSMSRGSMTTGFTLPAYVSRNQERALRFTYSSAQAHPMIVLPFNVNLPYRVAIPETISTRLVLGGVDLDAETYIDATDSALSPDGLTTLRAPIVADAAELPTGLHPYRARVANNYASSTFRTSRSGRAVVINKSADPLGSGWSLDGLSRLYETSDQRVLLEDGSGGYRVFDPLLTQRPLSGAGCSEAHGWTCEGPLRTSSSTAQWVFPSTNANHAKLGESTSVAMLLSPTSEGTSARIDKTFRGTMAVIPNAATESNVFGLVFGLQSLAPDPDPLPSCSGTNQARNCQQTYDSDFVLVDWRKADGCFTPPDGMGGAGGITLVTPQDPDCDAGELRAREGFTMSRVHGVVDMGRESPQFMGHVSAAAFKVLATRYGEGLGWEYDRVYHWEVVYESDRVRFSIDGEQIFDIKGAFEPGRYGFYAIGQDDVEFEIFQDLGATVNYTSPPGDFTTLEKNPSSCPTGCDCTFTRTFRVGKVKHHFDANGLQTCVEEPNGDLTTFEYTDGQLTTITDPAGKETTLAYGGDDRLESITDPAGRATTFTHDIPGNLIEVAYPQDGATEATILAFDYDRRRMTLQRDANGFETTYHYNSAGALESVDVPFGAAAERVVAAQDLSGMPAAGEGTPAMPTSHLLAEDAGASLEDAEGRVREFKLGRLGAATQVTDEATGLTTNIVRDENANPTSIVLPNEQEYTLEYFSGGTSASQIAKRGFFKSFADEALAPDAWSVDYSTTLSLVNKITDPFAKATNITFDAAAVQPSLITSPEGRDVAATYYTSAGRQIETLTDAAGVETTFTYYSDGAANGGGNVHEIIVREGETDERLKTFTYTPEGYVASVASRIDAMNDQTVSYTYDDLGQVRTATLPGGREMAFDYDAAGNLTMLKPPGALPHRFSYEAGDVRSEYQPPPAEGFVADDWDTLYVYNKERQLATVSRPDGGVLTLHYDASGRLDDISLGAGGTLDYVYDASAPGAGNLKEIESPDGVLLTLGYHGSDASSTLASVGYGGVTGIDATVSWTPRKDGRVATQTLDLGSPSAISFAYDDDGLLTGAGSLTVGRDADSGLIETTTLGSVTSAHGPNTFGEPLTADYAYNTSTSLAEFTYAARDGLGRITELDESILGATEVAFAYVYDGAGRLAEVWKDDVLRTSYAYDPNGNRLARTEHVPDPDVTVEGVYDNQDRLRSYGDLVFTYGANGELATRTDTGPDPDEATSYVYDLLGDLKSVALPDATLIEYLVDGLGRRVGKVVDSVLEDEFYYADGLAPVAWIDGNGDAARFVYGTRANAPDYMVKDGATYRIVSDHLGSPRLVVNASTGAVVQRTDYDEFGRATDVTVAMGWVPIPIGFAGGLYDRDTGLVRFGARDYDPEVGRWIAKDPILFAGGDGNLYGYVLGDPVNLVDPSGKIIPIIVAAFANPFTRGAIIGGTLGLISGIAQGQSAKEVLISTAAGAVAGLAGAGLTLGVGALFQQAAFLEGTLFGSAFKFLPGAAVGFSTDLFAQRLSGCNELNAPSLALASLGGAVALRGALPAGGVTGIVAAGTFETELASIAGGLTIDALPRAIDASAGTGLCACPNAARR